MGQKMSCLVFFLIFIDEVLLEMWQSGNFYEIISPVAVLKFYFAAKWVKLAHNNQFTLLGTIKLTKYMVR